MKKTIISSEIEISFTERREELNDFISFLEDDIRKKESSLVRRKNDLKLARKNFQFLNEQEDLMKYGVDIINNSYDFLNKFDPVIPATEYKLFDIDNDVIKIIKRRKLRN